MVSQPLLRSLRRATIALARCAAPGGTNPIRARSGLASRWQSKSRLGHLT